MAPTKDDWAASRSGMALVMMLVILVLITAVVVALVTLATSERSSANLTLRKTQAGLLADAASDMVMGTIDKATLDGSQPGTSWASEPGRIWIFNIAPGTGAITRRSVDLFSALAKADPDNVDLNLRTSKGEYPIAPPAVGNTTATMKVGWKEVLTDPTQTASKDNPILGRIAFWVDDESCKVNLNTADGSRRINATPTPAELAAMATDQKYSFGFGTPSEINLAALAGLDAEKAVAIADYAWQQEYNATDEITRAEVDGVPAVTREMFNALRFDITHYNSSPDLNFMGEPRIQLLPGPIDAAGTIPRLNTLLGPYSSTAPRGETLDVPYPQPSQMPFPANLPAADQLYPHTYADGGFTQQMTATKNDFYVGRVITNYLSGKNLHPSGQNTFAWPKFAGVVSEGFSGKYTPRQLDSITLQILDTVGKTTLCDQYQAGYNSGWSRATILTNGWLSNAVVMGVGRAPKMTEIMLSATVVPGDPFGYGTKIGNGLYQYPCVQLKLNTEYYLPKGYAGVPLNEPFTRDAIHWRWYPDKIFNNFESVSTLNSYDMPHRFPDEGPPENRWLKSGIGGPSQFGTVWGDSMLKAFKQDGTSAGIDFAGCPSKWRDPDQARAAQQHPYAELFTGSGTVADPYVGTKVFCGANNVPSNPWESYDLSGAWMVRNNIWYDPGGNSFHRFPGCYISNPNAHGGTFRPADPTATSIRLVGGLLYASGFSNAAFSHTIVAPLDALEPELTHKSTSYPQADIDKVNESTIPIDLTLTGPTDSHDLVVSVADPLVNQMPGDWKSTLDPAPTKLTMKIGNYGANYATGGKGAFDPSFVPSPAVTKACDDFNGDNLAFRASGGGDPLSVWLPNQDMRIPKQARFPSVGALFSVRTGVFPDITITALPKREQYGMPFRALNMAPSTARSQQTLGGSSYPDWAMLDLFTVPFLPQKPYFEGETPKPFRRLTYGGATIGRININNPEVPYPFGNSIEDVAQTPPKRNALQALFLGLKPSNSYDAGGQPIYTTIDATESAKLAKGISDYQQANGPFLMAGEIANVPEVANYLYTGDPILGLQTVHPLSVSRNDVVRDVVGAITTRSNVYSVWVVAQTIRKIPTNLGYGLCEPGDKVTSGIRRRYLIERYIDTGKDGVPGNAVNPATANTPNGYLQSTAAKPKAGNGEVADPIYHPALTYPLRYRWRIISVDDFAL